jgi:DNA helicase-2/ATP-dependent DNA helicase PcrA
MEEKTLNNEQLLAVQDAELCGPSLIIAGAGSGKTTVLSARVAYLQNYGKNVKGILVISFTRKAVAELKMRLLDDSGVTVTTFHSLFYRILKSNGYKSFSIITDDRTRTALVKRALAISNMEDKLTPDVVIEALAKGNFKGHIKTVVEAYFDLLKQQRLLDFDSLQYFCLELLESAPAVVRAIRSTYSHILIDEANDINHVQWLIIRKLWSKSANLCLVGDHRQAIYGFRGSYAKIFSDYIEHYNPRIYELTKCYRCSQGIVDLANSLMSKDTPMEAAKTGSYNKPAFYAAENAREEAKYICSEIKAAYIGGAKLNDMVILYRSAPVVSAVCEELLSQDIPYVKLGATSDKWSNNPYKPVLALLSYLYDISDDRHLTYCSQVLGIPADIATKAVANHKQNQDKPIVDILTSLPMLSKVTKNKLVQFYYAAAEAKEMPLRQAVLLIWDLLVRDYLKEDDDSMLEEILAETDKYQYFDDLKQHIIRMRQQYKAMAQLTANKNADYIRSYEHSFGQRVGVGYGIPGWSSRWSFTRYEP